MSPLTPPSLRKGDPWFDGTPLSPWAEDSAWPGGLSALLAQLQVMSGICNSLCITVSLSTLQHWLRFGQWVINEQAKREINTVITEQGDFSSVSWGKQGYTYRNSDCRAKTSEAWEGQMSESCTVPASLSSAVPPVNKDRVEFSVPTTALTTYHVQHFFSFFLGFCLFVCFGHCFCFVLFLFPNSIQVNLSLVKTSLTTFYLSS